MTILLELRDAHKRYGHQVILDGAGFCVDHTDKTALIGKNGCGKSTVCKALIGEEELDSGQVIKHPDLRIGYLRQHDPFSAGESALEFLVRDSGEPEWRCGAVAGEFEIKGRLLNGPVGSLSGGWQTRVKLAALLLHEPNLLIMDEPTNFLDLRTQLLLERFLREIKAACLVVSHDRTFLKSTCEKTLEMSRGRIATYEGDVESWVEHKEQLRTHDEKVNKTVLAKRRQLQRFIDKNRGSPKTSSQARSKAKQMERLTLIDIEEDEASAHVRVPHVEPRKGVALRVDGLAIGYPDLEVASGITVDVEHGSRVVVVGDNGQGKTTFLRTITGSLPSRGGTCAWGHGVKLGYYAQLVYSSLPGNLSVMEYLDGCAAGFTSPREVRTVAGSFLFGGADIDKPISVLSGGERARTCLAGLLLGGANVLVLDEPGNHLDVETVDGLADALKGYQGTVIFTSHDRHFMERVATSVLEVRDGRIVDIHGGYEHYLWKVSKEIDEGFGTVAAPAQKQPKDTVPREDRKEAARRKHQLLKEATSIERKMEKIEDRKRALDESMATSDRKSAARMAVERDEATSELAELEARWVKIHEEVDGLGV